MTILFWPRASAATRCCHQARRAAEAQNIRAIATAPWLFCPGIAVIVAVLALNFVGDGLRDAADPYRQ